MQLVIIGGGASLTEGLEKGLKQRLKDKYCFTLNYAYKHFEGTAEIFVDDVFYHQEAEELSKLPLILGQAKRDIKKVLPNSLLFQSINTYTPRDISKGIYKSQLCGLWAITTALYLLDEGDEIMLLGYDNGKISEEIKSRKYVTHYYQGEIKHRGIGHLGYYNGKTQPQRDYGVFADEKLIKIYNVSPKSRIEVFQKIDYDTFFQMLDDKTYSQEGLREEIRRKLK